MQQFWPSYSLYNPMLTPQQRIAQYEQQYPQFVQSNVQSSTMQSLTIVPVTNVEEANAFRVDLNGTPTFFYNAGKNEVYLKRTNTQTGLADFQTFAKIEQTVECKDEVNIANYEKDFKILNDKIDILHTLISTAPNFRTVTNSEVTTKGGKGVK